MAFLSGMLSSHGKSIVRDNLIYHVDASLSQSYSGSGTSWTDIGSSANPTTLFNGPAFNSTNGGTLFFDGANDFVRTTNTMGITGNAARTMSIWFYPTDLTATRSLIRFGTTSTSRLFEMIIDATYVGAHMWGSGWAYTPVYGKAATNTWCYAAMTFNSTTLTVYFDGVSVGSSNSFSAMNTGDSVLTIAGPAYHSYFKGYVANASLYNRALSADEISQNYQAGKKLYN